MKPRDIVRLRSGGGCMTVAQVIMESDGIEYVRVIWMDKDDHLQMGQLPSAILKMEAEAPILPMTEAQACLS